MVGPMMWFKREPKPVEKTVENGVAGKLRRKKAVLLKPTRESSERETSTESEKEKRRYSDILDIKVSQGMFSQIIYATCYIMNTDHRISCLTGIELIPKVFGD